MESLNNKTSEKLLAALDGDKVAQQILFSQYYDLIASVAWEHMPDGLAHLVSKEDLVQDILRRVLQKLHTFDRARVAEFPGWLKTVARSEVADRVKHLRVRENHRIEFRNNSRESAEFPDRYCVTHSLPDKSMRLEEAKEALLVAMEILLKPQREAIHRKYFLGESHKEIAIAMGRTEGAVRELLRRGEENLEKQLGTQSNWITR